MNLDYFDAEGNAVFISEREKFFKDAWQMMAKLEVEGAESKKDLFDFNFMLSRLHIARGELSVLLNVLDSVLFPETSLLKSVDSAQSKSTDSQKKRNSSSSPSSFSSIINNLRKEASRLKDSCKERYEDLKSVQDPLCKLGWRVLGKNGEWKIDISPNQMFFPFIPKKLSDPSKYVNVNSKNSLNTTTQGPYTPPPNFTKWNLLFDDQIVVVPNISVNEIEELLIEYLNSEIILDLYTKLKTEALAESQKYCIHDIQPFGFTISAKEPRKDIKIGLLSADLISDLPVHPLSRMIIRKYFLVSWESRFSPCSLIESLLSL